jgi:hypothetical protein
MSTANRLTLLENSVLRLATAKLDVVTHQAHISLEDDRYLDLVTSVTSLADRVTALEEWAITRIQATGT